MDQGSVYTYIILAIITTHLRRFNPTTEHTHILSTIIGPNTNPHSKSSGMAPAKPKKTKGAKKVPEVGTSTRKSGRKKAAVIDTNVDSESGQGREQDVDPEGSGGVDGMGSSTYTHPTIDPPVSERCYQRHIAGCPGHSDRRQPERGE
jgi:hypothetical protein